MARRSPSTHHETDDISIGTIKAGLAKIQASLTAAATLIPAHVLDASGLADDLAQCRSTGLNHLGLSTLQEIGRFAGACGDEESLPKTFWGHLADAAQGMAFDAFLPYLRGKEAGNLGKSWADVKPAVATLVHALPASLRKKHAALTAQMEAYVKADKAMDDSGPDPAFKAMWDGLFTLITDPSLPTALVEIAWPIIDSNTFGIRLGDGEGALSTAEVWWRSGSPPAPEAPEPRVPPKNTNKAVNKPAKKAATKAATKPSRAPAKKAPAKPTKKAAPNAGKKAATKPVKKAGKKPGGKPVKKAPPPPAKKRGGKSKPSRAR